MGGIRLGLPSKGRLRDEAAAWFAARGVIVRPAAGREYAGRVEGAEGVELVLLSAGEAPRELAAGRLHLAVTGEDLIRERIPGWEAKVALAARLGFGRADLVVAVPAFWADVESVDDLDAVAARFRAAEGRPLRIATKYHVLTRRFLRARGVADYRLVDSQGATEGVVRNGVADAIADITSSGETLRANGLRALRDGLVLASQAALWRSLTAPTSARQAEILAHLSRRLDAPLLETPPVAK